MISKAVTMFRDIGFHIVENSEKYLSYMAKTDYEEMIIWFKLDCKLYQVYYSRFIDDPYNFVPMEERNPNIKHSAYYGHWQTESCIDIDYRLHKVIHQQIIELGWLDDE